MQRGKSLISCSASSLSVCMFCHACAVENKYTRYLLFLSLIQLNSERKREIPLSPSLMQLPASCVCAFRSLAFYSCSRLEVYISRCVGHQYTYSGVSWDLFPFFFVSYSREIVYSYESVEIVRKKIIHIPISKSSVSIYI